MDYLLAAAGLAILLVAGDLLVKGAVALALRLGIPALIVGLTIVAFGTSAPELLISVSAVLSGAPGLALGNVIGSNTANILLVLGLPAMIATLRTGTLDVRRSYSVMIAATLIFIVACFFGPLTWITGLILLAIFAVVLADQARAALRDRRRGDERTEAETGTSGLKIAAFIVIGLAGLPFGADIFVKAAMSIATRMGVSQELIGLTLVAVGTSLPELATTAVAAWRRQADVALGNVIGSNLFNLLSIMGIASLFGSIPVPPSFLRFDLWVMLGAALLLAPFVFSSQLELTKRWGFALTAAYALYVLALFLIDEGAA